MSGLVKVLGGAVGTLLGGPLGGLLAFGAAGALMKKKDAGPKALPQVDRDLAEAQQTAMDDRLRRIGSAADMMNGTTGYEAGASTTGRLVVGS